MADEYPGETIDYVETLYKQIQERTKVKGIANEFQQNGEYSAARDILKNLLEQQREGDARLDTLLQIGECDVCAEGKLSAFTDREISKIVKANFPSYIEVIENAKQHKDIRALIMYLFGCRAAKEQATPDRAVTEIDNCTSETKSTVLQMGKDSDTNTKRIAHKAMSLLQEMVELLKGIEGADETKKAVVEAECLNKIGYSYNDFSRHRSAKPFLEEGKKIMEAKLKDTASKYHILAALENNIGFVYSQEGDHATAAFHYGKAMVDIQKAVDLSEKQRADTLASYEKSYVRHLSDPSVNPADVTRISGMVEQEKATVTTKSQETPPVKPTIEENKESPKVEKSADEGPTARKFHSIGNGIMVDYSDRLREGCYVFLGQFGGRDVAVKRMEYSDAQCTESVAEVEKVKRLKAHPNLVEYVAIYEKASGEMPGIKFLFIAMELCERDTLYELAGFKSFGYKERIASFLHMTTGLAYLHKQNIVHGDLKPSNVLRSVDKSHFKIADCGLGSGNVRGTRTQVGAAGYPEKNITEKADIYSAGFIFYHTFTMGSSDEGVVDLEKLLYPDVEISKDLVSSLLKEDPNQRPSAEDVLKHPFFWGNDKWLCFYRDVADSLQNAPKNSVEQLSNEINGRVGTVFEKDLASDVVSSKQDRSQFAQEVITELASSPTGVDKADGTEGETESSSKKMRAVDFVLFIKRKIAESEEGSGDELWAFLSGYLPKFFMEMYHVIQEQLDKTKLEEGFETLRKDLTPYFENTASGCVEPVWTESKKFDFLCRVSEEEDLSDLYKEDAAGDWMTLLQLDVPEIETIQAVLVEGGSRIKVEKWAVFNRSLETIPPEKVELEKHSLASLLRFMNDLKKRFVDDGNQIKAIFHNDSDKIWPFFKKRFPALFQKVRNSVSVSPRYNFLVSEFLRET